MLLEVGTHTHDQKTLQRNVLLLTEFHEPRRRLTLQMENVKRRIYICYFRAEARPDQDHLSGDCLRRDPFRLSVSAGRDRTDRTRS